jgi:hypothetical protein
MGIGLLEQRLNGSAGDAPEAAELDAGEFAAGDQVLDVLAGATESGGELGWRVTESLNFGLYGRRETFGIGNGRDHETSIWSLVDRPQPICLYGALQAMRRLTSVSYLTASLTASR